MVVGSVECAEGDGQNDRTFVVSLWADVALCCCTLHSSAAYCATSIDSRQT